jgi:hypothetical protein
MVNIEKIKLTADSPITGESDDLMNFQQPVSRLSNLISNIEPPFTLGIYGPWGSGKSSFMNLLEEKLTQNSKFVSLNFNAWQYENESSLLLPLLSKIAAKFNGKKDTTKKIKKISTSLVLLGGNVLTKVATQGMLNIKDIKGSLTDAEEMIGEVYDKWISEVDKMHNAFANLVKEITRGEKTLMILIDDLDRCLPENVIKLLENIKHFLNVSNCIFIISVDKDVLSRGIEARYGSDLINGNEYLEKIIGISFNLPQNISNCTRFVLESSKKMIIGEWSTEIENNISDLGNILDNLEIPHNPRRIRFLNQRVLLFLTLDDIEEFNFKFIFALLAIKEFFPGLYAYKKYHGNISTFPNTSEFGPKSNKENANVYGQEHFDELLKMAMKTGKYIDKVLSAKDAKGSIKSDEYFEMVDFLYSIQA